MTPAFTFQNQGALLWILAVSLLPFPYGAITLFRAAFQRTSGREVREGASPNTTFLAAYAAGSVCPVPLSLAVTCGIALLSFLLPTKMLQSSRLLSLARPPKGRRIAFGNPGVNACMRLTRAYRSLLRPSSSNEAKPSTNRCKFA